MVILPPELTELLKKWRTECDLQCQGCKDDWSLGRHGCHYEPVPADHPIEMEDWYGAEMRCKKFTLRRAIRDVEELYPKT